MHCAKETTSMIESTSNENTIIEKKKRTSRPKVRSGCQTCKIRHKKCDEGRPACLKCTSSGRHCEYRMTVDRRTRASREGDKLVRLTTAALVEVVHSQSYRSDMVANFSTRLVLPLMDVGQVDLSRQERVYLDFFRRSTSFQCAGYFHDEFWQRLVPQASEAQPAVRHAVIGLGAFHWTFVQLRARQMQEIPDRSFSLQQINKAIAYLQQDLVKSQSDRLQTERALVACVIFISTLLLQENVDLATEHLRSGYKLLDHYLVENPEESSVGSALKNAFAGVYLVCSTFGCQDTLKRGALSNNKQSFKDVNPSSQDESPLALPDPNGLSSVNDYLQCGRDFILCLVQMIQQNNPRDSSSVPTDATPSKKISTILTRLKDWQDLIKGCRNDQQYRLSQRDLDALTLLELWSEVLQIMLNVEVKAKPRETIYDDFLPQFQKAVRLAKILLVSDSALSPMPMFSVNTGVIPPLFLCAFKCRDWQVRQEALSLLSRWRRQEGIWSSCITALIVKRAIDIEMEGFTPEDVIPESSRIESIHVETSPDRPGLKIWYRRSQIRGEGGDLIEQPWKSEWLSYETGKAGQKVPGGV